MKFRQDAVLIVQEVLTGRQIDLIEFHGFQQTLIFPTFNREGPESPCFTGTEFVGAWAQTPLKKVLGVFRYFAVI